MRPQKDYETVLAERIRDTETLLIYFNVTRVRQYYTKRDGTSQFVLASWQSDRRFWAAWRKKDIKPTPWNRIAVGKAKKAFNEIHGIPHTLLHRVIGKFRHNDIKVKEVFSRIHGYTHYDKGQNRYKGKLKDSFCQKWIMNDKNRLTQLIVNPIYDTVETIPNASERIIDIIKEWEA